MYLRRAREGPSPPNTGTCREEREKGKERERKEGRKTRKKKLGSFLSYRLLPWAVQLPPELFGHGEHLFFGRSSSLGLLCVSFYTGERKREEKRGEKVEKRGKRREEKNDERSQQKQKDWINPLFRSHTHPGHVGALDELGQQGPGAVPALVGVAALLRVALLVVAAPLELALVMPTAAATAALIVVAPSAAVTSAAAVHVRLARERRRLEALINGSGGRKTES